MWELLQGMPKSARRLRVLFGLGIFPVLRGATPLDWLRQRAALLDEDPQAAADGFAALMQRDDLSGPAQERDWP